MSNTPIDLDLDFESGTILFDSEFESTNNEFDAGIEESNVLPIYFNNDHRLLTHKDDNNQHTIGSITNLQSTLEDKLDEADITELNNLEILSLWNHLMR